MTWELIVAILEKIALAIIGGGLAVQWQKSRTDKRARDEANDQNIRGELWKEVKEIRLAEGNWTQERIEYERKAMKLEQENREKDRFIIEQNEEILKLQADVDMEKRRCRDCEGRWGNFLKSKEE